MSFEAGSLLHIAASRLGKSQNFESQHQSFLPSLRSALNVSVHPFSSGLLPASLLFLRRLQSETKDMEAVVILSRLRHSISIIIIGPSEQYHQKIVGTDLGQNLGVQVAAGYPLSLSSTALYYTMGHVRYFFVKQHVALQCFLQPAVRLSVSANSTTV